MPWEISELAADRQIVGARKRDISTNRGTGRLRRFVGQSCPYCFVVMTREYGWHSPAAPSRDHRTPTSRGGMNVAANIVVCCRQCNELKGALDEDEFAAWKDGRLSRLDDGWWDKLRRLLPDLPRHPYVHYARLRLQLNRVK
jgi:5-methylcytosine-specific restriction endonuclease McrA